MPNYRRYHVAGGTYFFTLKTEWNAPLFAELASIRLVGEVFREMKTRWPLTIDALVLLPDHLHAIWTLPPGDSAYPVRWGWLKKEFTIRYLFAGGVEQSRSKSRRRNRRRGIWQRHFWEHTIQDEDDFDAYFDYVHWNPVKHGYVKRPIDWPHSSFHRWLQAGVYESTWGGSADPPGAAGRVIDAGE